MNRYRVKHVEPTFKDVECFAVEVINEGGIYFYVGNQAIARLRPQGDLLRLPISASCAAESGLQLDSKSKVKCD